MYFLEPILAAHDHGRFEIFCFADVPKPDATTRRLEACADHWRLLVGLSDAQAAEVIRQEGIDILVDLAGHTGGNRLPMFARKPAPIQASYLGYLGTTGVPAMDYYITDAYADPPGMTDAQYHERLIRLPDCAILLLSRPGAGYQPRATRLAGRPRYVRLPEQPRQGIRRRPRGLVAGAGSRSRLPAAAPHCGES